MKPASRLLGPSLPAFATPLRPHSPMSVKT